jgi:hypothetical protein
VKRRVSPHFGSKSTKTVSQARKEAAPQHEAIATAISNHEAAKHLKAAQHTLYDTIFEQNQRTA